MDLISSRPILDRFVDSGVEHATLALVYGRRRIGKSTLLSSLVADAGGFYWEATRAETAVHLARLGESLGAHLGTGRIAFDSWQVALASLLSLGAGGHLPVVLDEFGYILESDPTLDSVVASALGPAARRDAASRTRLILCGSAMSLMRALTRGEAPLRGRAGLELVMQPMEFRHAASHLPRGAPLDLAAAVYAVIGGVIGYHTDMVDHDLPSDLADFDRWVIQRVLSPAATLHHEATTLLAEDPSLSPGSPALFHSILGAIANGSVTAGHLSKRLSRPVANLDPPLKRLIAAGFVLRTEDPIRSQRPTYALADPFLQFHYAVLEPYQAVLRERDIGAAWRDRLAHIFASRVRGPVFEEMTRSWVRRYAAPSLLGGDPDFVGASAVTVDGVSRQIDVVVATAADPLAPPGERSVLSLGEAKSGETMTLAHLRELEAARAALGARAASAKLLLFAPRFQSDLEALAAGRPDVELVDLARLYHIARD